MNHQDTTFHLTNLPSSYLTIQQKHRKYCDYIQGNQNPYNYNWMFYNISANSDGTVTALSEVSKEWVHAKIKHFYHN